MLGRVAVEGEISLQVGAASAQHIAQQYALTVNCTVNCDSSDEGQENVEYCEEDEARLNPEDHNLSLEERYS